MFELLTFSNLAGLSLALASPLLVLAYLQRKPQKKLTVSSALILRQLPQTISLKRKIKIPSRFYFELFLLLLLALALATPMVRSMDKQVAVLVDNSLSMQAVEEGTSRVELVIRKAEALLSSSASYSVYSSSPKLERSGQTQLSASAALQAIKSISPSLAPDRLESSIQRLGESGRYNELLVISDRQILLQPQTEKPDQSTRINAVQVGDRLENLFISSAKVTEDPQSKESQVVIRVGSAGIEANNLRVTLSKRSTEENAFTAIDEKQISVPLNEVRELRFPLRETQSEAIYKANVEQEDELSFDNSYVFSTGKGSSSSLLLVTEKPGTLGLEGIPGFEVQRLSPENAAKLSEQELKKFALLIYHYSAPAEAPPVPSLLIAPPSGFFPTGVELKNPSVTSWKSDHPLTRYLKVALIRPFTAVTLVPPLWAQSVINIESGSLLAAGEVNGIRHAAIGMEILPFEGRRTPASTVLTLNLLSWLNRGAKLGSALSTGASYRLPEAQEWIITLPDGKKERITEQPAFLELSQAGAYIASSDTEKLVVTAAAFAPEESGEAAPLEIPAQIRWQRVDVPEDKPLWPIILLVVLVALLADTLWNYLRGFFHKVSHA